MPGVQASALDPRLDPLSELMLVVITAVTRGIRGLRQGIRTGSAMISKGVAIAR